MNNFLKNNKKYVIFIVGFMITILLTIAIVYLNKVVFDTAAFKTIKNYSDKKLLINDLIGFAEIIVVFSTFILFLTYSKEEK